MMGLTTLGIVHTLISLIALFAGIVAFVRYREISARTQMGRVYIVATVLTCLTGFGIFQHGGFGKAHVLGIVTLLVLGVALLASKGRFGQGFSPYLETVAYSMTFFFHLIPGFTESLTRLPLSEPFASGPDDPRLQPIIGVCFLLFLIGTILQVRALRKKLSL